MVLSNWNKLELTLEPSRVSWRRLHKAVQTTRVTLGFYGIFHFPTCGGSISLSGFFRSTPPVLVFLAPHAGAMASSPVAVAPVVAQSEGSRRWAGGLVRW